METEVLDVLVVGGGLGGLALAIGLQKLGLNWRLAEAAPELRTATGTLISLAGNAITALEGISADIPAAIKSKGIRMTSVCSSQRPLDGPREVRTSDLSETPLYNVGWAATQEVLAGLVDRSRVLCGHKCTGFSEGPGDLITAHFNDKPDIRARLVIGADGVRSAIRATMQPNDKMRYLGFMNWNSLRHVPGSSSQPDAGTLFTVAERWFEGWTTQVYMVNAGSDCKFWQVRIRQDHPTFTSGATGGAGVPGSKARVLEHLRQRGWDDVVAEVEATDEALIYERAMWDRAPLPTWSAASGRVLLLGDAAHAMYPGPGQGARQAFEDAHQLVLALREHWPDVTAAAAQYEDARVQRASFVQNYAASAANLPELSREFAAFWKQLGGSGSDDLQQQQQQRWRAFRDWMEQFPENPRGNPGCRWTAPEVVADYNRHCAQVAARLAAEGRLEQGSGAEFV